MNCIGHRTVLPRLYGHTVYRPYLIGSTFRLGFGLVLGSSDRVHKCQKTVVKKVQGLFGIYSKGQKLSHVKVVVQHAQPIVFHSFFVFLYKRFSMTPLDSSNQLLTGLWMKHMPVEFHP